MNLIPRLCAVATDSKLYGDYWPDGDKSAVFGKGFFWCQENLVSVVLQTTITLWVLWFAGVGIVVALSMNKFTDPVEAWAWGPARIVRAAFVPLAIFSASSMLLSVWSY